MVLPRFEGNAAWASPDGLSVVRIRHSSISRQTRLLALRDIERHVRCVATASMGMDERSSKAAVEENWVSSGAYI